MEQCFLREDTCFACLMHVCKGNTIHIHVLIVSRRSTYVQVAVVRQEVQQWTNKGSDEGAC